MRPMATTLNHLQTRIIPNGVSNHLRAYRRGDWIDSASNNQRRTRDVRDLCAHVHSSHLIRKEM